MTVDGNKQWFMDLMIAHNLTFTSMARELGIDKSALSRSLDGKRQVKALEVGKIATILGVSREDVILHLEGIASAAVSGGQGRPGKGYSRGVPVIAAVPPDGFGEEPQVEIRPAKRPLHPGIGYMKGLIKFAPGFDGTGPYSDENWEDIYLGEDLTGRNGKARSK